MIKKLAKADLEIYGRMYWGKRREMYGYDTASALIKGFGLSDSQVARIIKYAEENADRWDEYIRMLERQG